MEIEEVEVSLVPRSTIIRLVQGAQVIALVPGFDMVTIVVQQPRTGATTNRLLYGIVRRVKIPDNTDYIGSVRRRLNGTLTHFYLEREPSGS